MEPLRTTDPFAIDFRKKFELTNKVVVITGACGLVGRAFCEAVAQFGGHVVVADIAASNPTQFAATLEDRHGRKMLGFALNVADRAEVNALKDIVLSTFGKMDGLVNAHQNKSHLIFESFDCVSDDNWDTVVNINLKGTFLTCQILGTWMAENGGGSVINIPSTYSVVAPNQNLYKGTSLGCPAAYSASKGGIDALSRYLASYWATKKVRVNMITPH
ncbi:MAG: hypothetical protein RL226_685, partial [Bacteroidota bacterium]